MHRIVPGLIIESYREGRYRGAFKAASLFLDISGFSAMTDVLMGHGQEGAEALAAMMRLVFDPLVEAIFSQGGMIVGYAGDAISALYPIETEGDEESAAWRALASAHAIQQGLTAHPPFETPYGSFHIAAKIGLAMGPASWGILRSRQGDRAVYYFRGAAVDDAARAEHQACAGDVILSEPIRRHLGSGIQTNALVGFHALVEVTAQLPAARPITLPAVDAATSAIFAPREVVTRDLQGEFRQTVPLFLRIPDVLDDQLQQFMYTVFDLQKRYAGIIDRIDFGDKGCSMVIQWGAPVAHENDIDRALGFILELQAQAGFPVTAGLTYYISYAGYIGGGLYEAYTAYGWGMNLAARFMMAAAQNEIWLDERILQRVSQRFHFDFVGEQPFKGFARKQKVYILRGRRSGSEALFQGRTVGRQTELQVLTDFVAPLWDGKYAGVAGIWGDAGLGKSRLVYEFRQSPLFQEKRCLWALCQSDEILQQAFYPFRYWLFRYFDVFQGQDHATRSWKFATRLDELIAATKKASLAAELKRVRPFLAALIDLEWPDSLYEQTDAQGRYDNTLIALISLLKAESLRQPLILFFEDAQYLDEDSKAFLPRFKRALTAEPVSYPIAVLLAARWQGPKVLLEDGLVDREIELPRLSSDAIASLCADFLGGPAASTLVKLVNDRAEGNPFFAEQTLRYLQEQAALEVSATGERDVKFAGKPAVLPGDISAMLGARLDQLAGPVKAVIQAASVLGRTFEVPVLRSMLGGASVQNEMTVGEGAAIWSPLSESRYIFNHALLRDVAYNMQLQARRQELHALAFHALRDSFGVDVGRHYGELAYHGELGALLPEARRCLSLAGDAARDEYQNAQALDYYRRALALVPETDLKERYRLHRECEQILAGRGSPEERAGEIQALQVLADALGSDGDRAEVLLFRAQLEVSGGRYVEAAGFADQARQLGLEVGRFDVAIGAYASLTDSCFQRAMYREAVEYAEQGIALARRQNAPQEEASILNKHGLDLLEMKNPSVARSYFERALSIFRAEGNLRGMARVLANCGNVAGYQGNYSTALDYYEQSLRLAREIGSREGECLLLGNMGWLCGLLGDYHKARAYGERSVQIAREIGDRYTETFSLINLSSHAGGLGESAVALEHARQALALACQSNDRNLQAWALTYLGHGLVESGMPDPAVKAYGDALDLRYQLDQPALATEPGAGLARVYLSKGDLDAARIQVDMILAQLEEDGTLEGTDQPLRVYLSCYLVLNSMQDARARSILNTAHDMLKTRANGISDPSGRQVFLEKVTYNREIMSLWQQQHQGEGPTSRGPSSRLPDRPK